MNMSRVFMRYWVTEHNILKNSLNISGTNKQKAERFENVDFIVNAKNTKDFEKKKIKITIKG